MVEVDLEVGGRPPYFVPLVLMEMWAQFALSGPETLARFQALARVRHEIVY